MMKTILIAADFSESSDNAAHYGYSFASQLKADIVLCNAIIVPAEIPQSGFVAWPTGEYEVLAEDSQRELIKLQQSLQTAVNPFAYTPHISIVNEAGIVPDVVRQVATQFNAKLIVAGTHSSNGIAELVVGDHVKVLIDAQIEQTLFIPPAAKYERVERVALALDLSNEVNDLAIIKSIVPLITQLDAELLLVHIDARADSNHSKRDILNNKISALATKCRYPKTTTLLLKENSVESGLEHICQQENIQMMALAHRPQGFFASIFKASHSKKMAGQICQPLLIFPQPAN